MCRALRTGVLTNGPHTDGFERCFAQRHQVEHGVAFANGTVALAAVFLGLGIGAGDEVIVPSMTFVSSATSVLHVGATPVFADIDPETFNLDPSDVERHLTPRTRAVLAVHYGGQPADMDELLGLTTAAGVSLVEDAAQAHGASYKGRPVATFGAAAMFSFTATKNITTGEGGMVLTNDGHLARRLQLLRNHGQTAMYRHEVVGYNWRLTEMQAALGEVQVAKLDGILERKRRNGEWMNARLREVPGVRPPLARADRDHVYMLYTALVDQGRDDVMAQLNASGIEARLYFPPAHRQPIFREYPADLPVTDEVAGKMLSLPFHSRLTAAELEDVAATLETAVASR